VALKSSDQVSSLLDVKGFIDLIREHQQRAFDA